MSDWSSGYVSDIDYTFGYYNELNPLRIKVALAYQGFAAPEISKACELGFGQGLSLNINAAGSGISWTGNDFNPQQAAFAKELSGKYDSDIFVTDDSFEELLSRDDLPDFDFICLHGIWSWISDDNRQLIVELIKKKLKLGGVVYVSYNTLPGWSSFAPMRHLLSLHAEQLGAEGDGIVSRIDGSIAFANQLLESEPQYLKVNPTVQERLKLLEGQNKHYLAHEFFNLDWHPMHYATMLNWLSEAKLQFACSAHLLDHIDVLNLTKEQQELLNGIKDKNFKESTRDFLTNQQFRRDYWVKGLRKITSIERADIFLKLRVVLTLKRDDVKLVAKGSLGEAKLGENVYSPILDTMADNKPISLERITTELPQLSFEQIVQAITVMIGTGHLNICHSEEEASSNWQKARDLNIELCKKSRSSGDITFLCSPVTGGGVSVTRFQQLFLLAEFEGMFEFEDKVSFVWQVLSRQGQKLIKDGKTLESAEENLTELRNLLSAFIDDRRSILNSLGIV